MRDHQIPASPGHRIGAQNHRVATPLGLYVIRIKGRLGATALSAFPSMASECKCGETVLTGVFEDSAAMFGALAQVMPATAQGIAQNLEVSGFEEADLLRPAISIRFGAFYLGHQLDMMEGSLPAALAAYNGGPGNATRWAGGNTVADPDLFTESIDYSETRGYVKLVYGYYGAYQRLYKAP